MANEQQRLRRSPVSRNLNTRVRVMGIELEDLLLLGVLAAGTLVFGNFVLPNVTIMSLPANLVLCVAVVLTGIPGLMLFKYNKPRGYLMDLIRWHLKPRAYCPLTPDTDINRPYIRPDEESERE